MEIALSLTPAALAVTRAGAGGSVPEPYAAPPADWRLPASVTVSPGLAGVQPALAAAQAASDAKARPGVTVGSGNAEYVEWTVEQAGDAILSFVPSSTSGSYTVEVDGADRGFAKQFPAGTSEADRRQGIVLPVTAGQVIRLTVAASGGSVTVHPLLHLKPAAGPWDGHLIFGPSLLQDGYKSQAMEASIIAAFPERDPLCFNYARTSYTASQLAGISDDAAASFGDCARYAWCGGLLANDIGNDTPGGTDIADLTASLTAIFDNLEGAGMTVGMGTTRYFAYGGTGAPSDQSTGVRAYDSAIVSPFIEGRIPYCYDGAIGRPRYDEYLLDLFRRDLHADTIHGSSAQYALERAEIAATWLRYVYTGSWAYTSQIEQRIAAAEASAANEAEALSDYTEAAYALLALDAGTPRDAFATRLVAIRPAVLFFEAKRLIAIAELSAAPADIAAAQAALDAAEAAGYVDRASPDTIAEQQARIGVIASAGFDQIINVQFGTASPGAGWNGFVAADTQGSTHDFVDENGDATDVDLTLTAWSSLNNAAMSTASEIEEWPDPHLDTRLFKSVSAATVVTVTGLEMGSTYDLVVPADGSAANGRALNLQVDGVDHGNRDDTDRPGNPWRISNLTPTGGAIELRFNRGTGTVYYFIGFVLKRHA